MKRKPYIIIADAECGRENLEYIEGSCYQSIQEFWRDEIVEKMRKRGYVQLVALGDFTTDWNDTDGENEYLNIMNTFIGYVFVEM